MAEPHSWQEMPASSLTELTCVVISYVAFSPSSASHMLFMSGDQPWQPQTQVGAIKGAHVIPGHNCLCQWDPKEEQP